jgi:hypothetical protein
MAGGDITAKVSSIGDIGIIEDKLLKNTWGDDRKVVDISEELALKGAYERRYLRLKLVCIILSCSIFMNV